MESANTFKLSFLKSFEKTKEITINIFHYSFTHITFTLVEDAVYYAANDDGSAATLVHARFCYVSRRLLQCNLCMSAENGN